MQTVQINGRFVLPSGQPADGKVTFIPSRLWYEEDGVLYANIAREVELVNGRFCIDLSRTDTEIPWHYTVICPVGKWTVFLTGEGPLQLRDLLPKRLA
jgi:hypothetical protein